MADVPMPGGNPDSGVETEESNDSTLSSVSGANAAPKSASSTTANQSNDESGPSNPGSVNPAPMHLNDESSPSNPGSVSLAPMPPVPPFQAPSTPNSAASSISGSTPATPEPHSLMVVPQTGIVPPASVTEDGYLGDCSSDGGNEKNFPMPPDKLQRLLYRQSDLSAPSTSSSTLPLGASAVDPPAGLSFQNIRPEFLIGAPLATGGGYQVNSGSHSRKMRSSSVIRSRVHHHSNHNNWSQMKASIAGRKLRLAANTNNTEALERLLEGGTNANHIDEHQRTALHCAAAKGYTEAARILLSYGADPNKKDTLGNTALHLAACTNHVGMVTILLRAGTNVAELDNNGRTPMQLAQSKLKILQKSQGKEMTTVKNEVAQVLEMMREYLHKCGHGTNKAYNDLLNSFSQRLTLHHTQQDINTDLKDLLNSLGNLQF